MPKLFSKVLKKIDSFQEDCADLILGMEILLGENVSIADISVNATPKKKLKESVLMAKGRDVKRIDSEGNVSTVTPKEVRTIETMKKKGYQTNDSDGEEKDDEDSEEITTSEKDKTGALRGKIIKTEKELEINDSLRDWVKNYFLARRQGNFSEADILRERIESTIFEKNLDKETVYYRGEDVMKDKEEREKKARGDEDEEPEDLESEE